MAYLENLNLSKKMWWLVDTDEHIRILLFSIYPGTASSSLWDGFADDKLAAFVVGDDEEENEQPPSFRLKYEEDGFDSGEIPEPLRQWAETVISECLRLDIVDTERDAVFRAHSGRKSWYFDVPLTRDWEFRVVS
jgi:hypothetical protein